jgi:hypothetical protein
MLHRPVALSPVGQRPVCQRLPVSLLLALLLPVSSPLLPCRRPPVPSLLMPLHLPVLPPLPVSPLVAAHGGHLVTAQAHGGHLVAALPSQFDRPYVPKLIQVHRARANIGAIQARPCDVTSGQRAMRMCPPPAPRLLQVRINLPSVIGTDDCVDKAPPSPPPRSSRSSSPALPQRYFSFLYRANATLTCPRRHYSRTCKQGLPLPRPCVHR